LHKSCDDPYYAANAGGRLFGIVLSGALTQAGGLPTCLWGSVVMLALCLALCSCCQPKPGCGMGSWRRLSSVAKEAWIHGLAFVAAAGIGAILVHPLLLLFERRRIRAPRPWARI
jgi:hypothetical protein